MKLLFFITKKYSISIIEPLQMYCDKNSIEYFWYKAGDAQNISLKGPCLFSNDDVLGFKPDAVIVPGNVVPDFWPGLKVQIFHGLCEEKRGHYDITGFFDLYCTSGPEMTDKFEILKKQYGSFLVKETGWPKLDPMCVRKSLSDAKIEQGLDPSKITILYAPTFSKRYTSSSDLINEIKILQNKGWQWIAKFHDLEQIEIIQEYKKLSSDQFNIVQDLDILPWMYAADILLTDTSSVAYEFLQLNRPIITYRAFARKGKGIDITNPENIYGALVRSIEDPNEFKTPRKEYLDDLHPYSDGKSSERVIKGIENILKSTELSQLKPKSMNWYRKRQIRKLVLK